jgi:hypothetical protein
MSVQRWSKFKKCYLFGGAAAMLWLSLLGSTMVTMHRPAEESIRVRGDGSAAATQMFHNTTTTARDSVGDSVRRTATAMRDDRNATTASTGTKNRSSHRGNNISSVQQECTVVYCIQGPLLGGLNNQLMGFFGLVLVAMKHDEDLRNKKQKEEVTCVCIPDVRCSYPKSLDRRKTKSLTDSINILGDGVWPSGLPPLYHKRITSESNKTMKVVELSWDTVWDSQTTYLRKLRKQALTRPGMPQRHPMEYPFFHSLVMNPSPKIDAALQNLHLPDEYVAIHARVEQDMRNHRFWNVSGKDLSSVLQIVHDGILGSKEEEERPNGPLVDGIPINPRLSAETIENAMKHVVLAVGTDLVVEDAAVLAAGKPPWAVAAANSSTVFMTRIAKPATLDYFDASLLDMILCVRATIFVGYAYSTFTNTAAFLRNDPKTTFDYSSGELLEQRYNGLILPTSQP